MKFLGAMIACVICLFGAAAIAAQDPCTIIKEACTSAGFIQGGAKDGKGLWLDCVSPIMQGTAPKKSVLPLPKVDSAQIAACKQKHPKFGEVPAVN
jgi:hypothetical protein